MITVWVATIKPVPEGETVANWQSKCARELLWSCLRTKGIVSEFVFDYEEGGKPFFVNHPEIQFNLSHSGAMLACAISDSPVGIDIQQIRPWKQNYIHKFSSCEQAFINQQPDSKKDEAFIWLWTRKESYMKYTGEGFKHALNSFSVLEGNSEYSIETQKLSLGYFVSVCGKPCQTIQWETVDE